MAAAGPWCPVGGRRRGRAGRGAEEGSAVLRRLREARDDLLSSGFWAASAGAVRAPLAASTEPPARCVCYGLGRFSGCPSARYQLAFLLLLLEELGLPPEQCWLFDPAFSEQEVAVLGQLGLRLLPDNEEGKHDVEGSSTLFYMVHCGKALYNNLLWKNWATGSLSKMVIVGNSFKGIEERFWCLHLGFPLLASFTPFSPLLFLRMISRFCSFSACSHQASPAFSVPHPCSEKLSSFLRSVVSDAGSLCDSRLLSRILERDYSYIAKELSPQLWDCVEEPTYQDCDDLEIIRKEEGGGRHSPTATQC
ncbi:SRR1-like protein isoform X2 [Apus apus]|uniref:SRR1-like protein isoform X2 n=1 Tax=Apus apus TaxID=8895 RepID=UPI0021F917E4|nr:SRR1-like protein isoform X2 [Apus apus]